MMFVLDAQHLERSWLQWDVDSRSRNWALRPCFGGAVQSVCCGRDDDRYGQGDRTPPTYSGAGRMLQWSAADWGPTPVREPDAAAVTP